MDTDNAFLGLGSNCGNRASHLGAALAALQESGLWVGAVSSFYLTEPDLDGELERRRHPWYVNCVASIQRPPEAGELLQLCLETESRFGRVRTSSGPEPRTLDLDLLLYGQEVIDEPRLRVPHPRLHRRRFALLPLSELAPHAWHPKEAATVERLLEQLPPHTGVWLLAPPPPLPEG